MGIIKVVLAGVAAGVTYRWLPAGWFLEGVELSHLSPCGPLKLAVAEGKGQATKENWRGRLLLVLLALLTGVVVLATATFSGGCLDLANFGGGFFEGGLWFAAAVVLLLIALGDLQYMIIADELLLMLGLLGVGLRAGGLLQWAGPLTGEELAAFSQAAVRQAAAGAVIPDYGAAALAGFAAGLLPVFFLTAVVYVLSGVQIIGGGDWKLLGAIGIWLGPAGVLEVQLAAFFAAGVTAAVATVLKLLWSSVFAKNKIGICLAEVDGSCEAYKIVKAKANPAEKGCGICLESGRGRSEVYTSRKREGETGENRCRICLGEDDGSCEAYKIVKAKANPGEKGCGICLESGRGRSEVYTSGKRERETGENRCGICLGEVDGSFEAYKMEKGKNCFWNIKKQKIRGKFAGSAVSPQELPLAPFICIFAILQGGFFAL